MQDRKQAIKTAKRKKAARPNKAALYCHAENAYRLGDTAKKRIYLNVRLSVDRASLRTIYKISRFFGYSASDTARQGLRFGQAESHGERLSVTRKYRAKAQAMIKAAKEGKRRQYTRQRLPGKPELWANSGEPGKDQLKKNRALFNITARDLADLVTEAEEMKLAGYREFNGYKYETGEEAHTLPPSVSMAFRRLMAVYLTIMRQIMAAIEARTNGKELSGLEYIRPTRAKRDRTITEVKKRIKEQGTKASL